MKKFLKISAIVFLFFSIVVVALPYLFKDKIVAYIKEDINNMVEAQVDFKDVDVSLFRNFPDFRVKLSDFSIDGKDVFQDKRLVSIKDLAVVIDIKSVLKGDVLRIKKVVINDADLSIFVNEEGLANYDITKKNPNEEPTESSHFEVLLNEYELKNINLSYVDLPMDFSLQMKNFQHTGTGRFSDTLYHLDTESQVDTLTMTYGGIDYLQKVQAKITSGFEISDALSKFTFINTLASINDLPLKADGFVKLSEDEILMDVNYESENANIVQLLSLLPKVYMPDLKGVQTSGMAKVSGYVKGKSTATDLPGFKVLVDVSDASIQYPDLPEKVSHINLLTDVDFKGGSDLNTMYIDISKIQFQIAGSEVLGHLNIKQPMTDPLIVANFKSDLDFAKVKQAVKYDQIQDMNGRMNADISFSGTMSAVEKQEVDKIQAKGFFDLKKFTLKTTDFKDLIEIPDAHLNLSPSQLEITKFVSKIGNNDFNIIGRVNNYLSYAMGKSDILKGDITIKSKKLNINDFMTADASETTPTEGETGVVKIPKNVDMALNLFADEVIFQKLDLKNVKGKLRVANEEAKLTEVYMDMMGGKVQMSGAYNTAGEHPNSSINVGLEQMDIKESATNLSLIQQYAPILTRLGGKFFSDLNLKMDFDQDMNPLFKTVNANGKFKTNQISAEGIQILSKIGDILKINEIKKPTIDKINASFKINDGTLTMLPHQFKLNGMEAGLSGTFDLDKNVDFVLTLDVPREKLGSNINSVLQNLSSAVGKLDLGKDIGQVVKAKFKITGTGSQLSVKPVLLGSKGQTLTETVQEVVQDKVVAVKNDALEKAQAEADKLMALARSQKEKLVQEAEKLALQTKEKAQLGADELLKNAGDNPLKKLAAKTAGDKLVKEGDKKALQITQTAERKGEELVAKAQAQSDELIQKASSVGPE